jgi:alpha-N-acetylglucosaminidase
MGNIQGWGGPVTLNWVEARFSLQLQILTRMRDLGMKPVLSAFAGHVPEGFVHRYPDANVTRSPNWGNFPAPYGQVYLLEATDVRFGDIGTR